MVLVLCYTYSSTDNFLPPMRQTNKRYMVIRIHCVISNDWIVTDYGGCDVAGIWIAMHIKLSSRLSNL